MHSASSTPQTHVVTGAFGYSGKYIARGLLERGYRVRTLTNSLQRGNPFGERVEAFPLAFQDPPSLVRALEGAEVLYNTYWVRFNHRGFSHARAVEQLRTLFQAAKAAGVRRVVHTSILNPSLDSPLSYFRGKAEVEQFLRETGLSFAILRPAVLFGDEDILLNNIAWALRHLPVFGLFGDGSYRLQPIHVEDFARLAIEQGARRENAVLDAIGPETYPYRELVETIARVIGVRRPLVSMPPALAYAAGWAIGRIMGDVFITHDEVRGLMANLLWTRSQPLGSIRLSDWARAHAATLGHRYASELARRRDLLKPYSEL